MQAAQVITTVPAVAPLADELMKDFGYQAPTPQGADPNFPVPVGMAQPQIDFPTNTSPMLPAQPASPTDGAMDGIETQRADGVQPNTIGA